MTIQELIKRAGGQSAFHHLTGIPLRTIQNWARGERQPTDYMQWLLSDWWENRNVVSNLRYENERLRLDVTELLEENQRLRETVASLCLEGRKP